MACFSGVAKAYDLPGSAEGYAIIEEFATKEVSSMLHMAEKDAVKIFSLGRILQCFLSSRFRIKNDIAKAKDIFAESKIYLDKITDSKN